MGSKSRLWQIWYYLSIAGMVFGGLVFITTWLLAVPLSALIHLFSIRKLKPER